jgi:hypothetical protein
MKIFGAGMAGLLAANMLRRYEPEVHELQASLPYNHGALLRFRSDAVARATGQPFQKVRVHKSVLWKGDLYDRPTLQMANSYSFKVTGRILSRSILDTSPVDRWIAPPDFIEKMSKGVNIILNSPLDEQAILDSGRFGPYISTIPMPFLMEMIGWKEKPIFLWSSIVSVTAKILDPLIDIHQTIYAANTSLPLWYRASIIGNHLTLEYMADHLWDDEYMFNTADKAEIEQACISDIEGALGLFGIPVSEIGGTNAKFQKFGKLKPVDDVHRRSFISGLTQEYGIYSLGRFATWRQILLDDVVKDVGIIDSFIQDKTEYSRHLRSVR